MFSNTYILIFYGKIFSGQCHSAQVEKTLSLFNNLNKEAFTNYDKISIKTNFNLC